MLKYLALAFTICAMPAMAQNVRIVDGDGIAIAGQPYRICGVNAAEMDTAEGRAAKAVMADIVRGKRVECRPVGAGTPCDGRSKPRSGKRIVAQCFADGQDIAAELVRRGAAQDWPRFSGGYYRQ